MTEGASSSSSTSEETTTTTSKTTPSTSKSTTSKTTTTTSQKKTTKKTTKPTTETKKTTKPTTKPTTSTKTTVKPTTTKETTKKTTTIPTTTTTPELPTTVPANNKTSPPKSTTTKKSNGTFRADYEAEILRLANKKRVAAGLDALTLNQSLVHSARIRAVEIVELKAHDRPDGSRFYTTINIPHYWSGEIIAWGTRTPEKVMGGWSKSEVHNRNIMYPWFSEAGVGCYIVNGVPHWVMLFVDTYEYDYWDES